MLYLHGAPRHQLAQCSFFGCHMTKMKFIGVADKQEHLLIVDDHDQEDGLYTIELDGRIFEINAKTMPSEIVSMLINDKSYDIDIDDRDQSKDPLDGRLSVRVRGRIVCLDMLEERRKKMKDAQISNFSASGVISVVSPMPGKILRYVVEEGQEVKEGEGLVVIEAMKMENELCSPKQGVVKKLASTPGAAVEGGALLLVIE